MVCGVPNAHLRTRFLIVVPEYMCESSKRYNETQSLKFIHNNNNEHGFLIFLVFLLLLVYTATAHVLVIETATKSDSFIPTRFQRP